MNENTRVYDNLLEFPWEKDSFVFNASHTTQLSILIDEINPDFNVDDRWSEYVLHLRRRNSDRYDKLFSIPTSELVTVAESDPDLLLVVLAMLITQLNSIPLQGKHNIFEGLLKLPNPNDKQKELMQDHIKWLKSVDSQLAVTIRVVNQLMSSLQKNLNHQLSNETKVRLSQLDSVISAGTDSTIRNMLSTQLVETISTFLTFYNDQTKLIKESAENSVKTPQIIEELRSALDGSGLVSTAQSLLSLLSAA